jgi:Subtilase family
MRMTETKGSLRGYLLRCIGVCLVLWLILPAASGGQPPPAGKCPPTVADSGQALSADNTLYTFKSTCTSRFWRAGTIVVAAASPTGVPIPPQQRQALDEKIIIQIQSILNKNLILDQSMRTVFVTPLEGTTNTKPSNSVLMGSTLALFLSLIVEFKVGPPQLIGDLNMEKAVNVINNNLPVQIGTSPVVFIDSSSPDWLTGGGGGGFTGGHPDGDPTAARDASWSTSCASGSGPVVYVLDTAHPLGIDSGGIPFHTGATKFLADPSIPTISPNLVPDPPAAKPACDFSHDIGASIRETDVVLDDKTDLNLKIFNPNVVNLNEFREHGLFVSDLIHHIAPQANIRLIRVLNDYGVGDLQALFDGFQLISQEHHQGAIVNLSLGLAPPPKCLQSIWKNLTNWENLYGGTRNQPQANIGACNGAVDAIIEDPNLKRLYVPLGLMIDEMAHLTGDHLTAAAGNDSPAFGAELPAAFCSVIAVGATNVRVGNDWRYETGTKLAKFSNVPYFDGSDCLGINAKSGVVVEQEHSDQENQSIVAVGIHICSLLLHGVNDPPGKLKGLASWQGTSFSTAIISGNLASNGGRIPSTLNETQPC